MVMLPKMYLNVPLCIKLQTFWQLFVSLFFVFLFLVLLFFFCEIWNILIFETLLTVQNSMLGNIQRQHYITKGFLKLFRGAITKGSVLRTSVMNKRKISVWGQERRKLLGSGQISLQRVSKFRLCTANC